MYIIIPPHVSWKKCLRLVSRRLSSACALWPPLVPLSSSSFNMQATCTACDLFSQHVNTRPQPSPQHGNTSHLLRAVAFRNSPPTTTTAVIGVVQVEVRGRLLFDNRKMYANHPYLSPCPIFHPTTNHPAWQRFFFFVGGGVRVRISEAELQ